jgi:hypothetical protein
MHIYCVILLVIPTPTSSFAGAHSANTLAKQTGNSCLHIFELCNEPRLLTQSTCHKETSWGHPVVRISGEKNWHTLRE